MRCEAERVESDVMMIVVFSSSILGSCVFRFLTSLNSFTFLMNLLLYIYMY